MSSPTISDAEKLMVIHDKKGVIILSFDDKTFRYVSYGRTMRDRKMMEILEDAAVRAVQNKLSEEV